MSFPHFPQYFAFGFFACQPQALQRSATEEEEREEAEEEERDCEGDCDAKSYIASVEDGGGLDRRLMRGGGAPRLPRVFSLFAPHPLPRLYIDPLLFNINRIRDTVENF